MKLKQWLVGMLLSCAAGTTQAHDVQQVERVDTFRTTVMSDLRNREVLVMKPWKDSGTPAPAIVVLHYLHGSPADMADLTAIGKLARDAGAWVIIPDGIQGKWNYGALSIKTVDDVKFLNRVIDKVVADYPVDPKRIYMTGYSNGGLMAVRYACEQPGRIAAVGVVATTIEPLDAVQCKPPVGIPMLYINGVQDPLIPFNGNLFKRSAADTLAMWRGFDGCTDSSVTTDLPDAVVDGTTVKHIAWRNCAAGMAVEQYVVEGGGHTWPGTQRFTLGLGKTSQDFNATDAIWQFVSAFSR